MKTLDLLLCHIEHLAPCEDGYKYVVDFVACYGGYTLSCVNKKDGSEFPAFGQSQARMCKKEFIAMLNGIIGGLSYANH